MTRLTTFFGSMLIRVGNIAFKDMYKLQFVKQSKKD